MSAEFFDVTKLSKNALQINAEGRTLITKYAQQLVDLNLLDEKVFKLIEGGQKIDLFKDDSKKTKIPKTIMDFIGQDSSVYTEDYWKKFKRGEGGLSKETIMNLVGKEPGKEININKSLNWEGDALDRWNNAIQNMPKENKE